MCIRCRINSRNRGGTGSDPGAFGRIDCTTRSAKNTERNILELTGLLNVQSRPQTHFENGIVFAENIRSYFPLAQVKDGVSLHHTFANVCNEFNCREEVSV
jgi:hypothetical protein